MKRLTKNYLLIHGGWHGSWCFDKYLIPSLEKNIYNKIYKCDLPGHSYNNKLNFKDITLNTY
jgi:hypothetical protein